MARMLSRMVRNLLAPLLGTLVVALAAQATLDVPGSSVPVSLQTLAVCLVGIFLGPGAAGLSLLVYLAAGALGLPVFAGGGSGAAKLAGTGAGFLWSFPVAAYGVSVGWRRNSGLGSRLGVLLAAHGGILVAGGLGLLAAGKSLGTLGGILGPLVPGAILKSLVALLVGQGFRSRRSSS